MSEEFDKLVREVADLKALVAGLTNANYYPAAARRNDERLERGIDRMGRDVLLVPLDLYDDYGAAAAAAATKAPNDAQYLVAALHADLTAERVATDTASIIWDFGTAAQAKAVRAALTGDVTASVGSNALTIANSAVTLVKMADLADQRIIGNVSGGTAAPQAMTQAMTRTFLGLGTAAFTASTDYDPSGSSAAVLAKAVSQEEWSVLGNLVSATTYYAAPGGSLLVFESRYPVTRACTAQRLFVRMTDAPGAGQSVTITMRKNGSDQAVVVTISDTATTGSDTTHTFALAAGDEVSISVVTSAAALPKNLTMAFELAPT